MPSSHHQEKKPQAKKCLKLLLGGCQARDYKFPVTIGGFNTTEKMKFSINYFSSKCDRIRSLLWIWSHLPENP